jgi:microcystin-dependent protein
MEGYIGQILMWAGAFEPLNWAFCAGQTLQISMYQALYSVIGNIYGGNGQTTFNLPDLRGRMPVGAGAGPGLPTIQLGTRWGQPTQTLTLENLPSHNHAAQFTPAGGGITVTGTGKLAVNTQAPSQGTPQLTAGQTAYLANAKAGALLQGLYTETAPTSETQANIPVDLSLQTSGGGGGTVTVDNTGLGQGFNLYPPSGSINFIICTEGQYPQRSN